jgi:hypothetical protein
LLPPLEDLWGCRVQSEVLAEDEVICESTVGLVLVTLVVEMMKVVFGVGKSCLSPIPHLEFSCELCESAAHQNF